MIKDGLSKTYGVGEKNVIASFVDIGNDQSALSGHDYDTLRWGGPEAPLRRDQRDDVWPHCFGSSHVSGTNIAMLDGAVRLLDYEIEQEVHRSAANIGDVR